MNFNKHKHKYNTPDLTEIEEFEKKILAEIKKCKDILNNKKEEQYDETHNLALLITYYDRLLITYSSDDEDNYTDFPNCEQIYNADSDDDIKNKFNNSINIEPNFSQHDYANDDELENIINKIYNNEHDFSEFLKK